jgi:glycosyltransferase involved in cell wall biosynthesis
VDGLAAALREAFDDPAAAAARGTVARQRVLERYTWDAKMRETEALYGAVLGTAAGPASLLRGSAGVVAARS